MNHFYQRIHGWFDFEKIYSDMVKISNNNSHFVEIGSWLGKSTSYMAVEISNSGKKIKFDAVDTWNYTKNLDDFSAYENFIKTNNINPYEEFLSNIKPIKNYINVIKEYSVDAAKLYNNESLDFIFIDGAHDYYNIKNDINAWFPKVKSDGYIGGHDYEPTCGVPDAINEFFGTNIVTIINGYLAKSWLFKK